MIREVIEREYGEEWAEKLEEAQKDCRGPDQNVIKSKVVRMHDNVIASLHELAIEENTYKLIRYVQVTPTDNSSDEEEAMLFIEKAEQNIEYARIASDRKDEEKFVEEICQAIEKILKADLVLEYGEYKHTHDLARLHERSSISKYEGIVNEFSGSYVPSRYPNYTGYKPEEDETLDIVLKVQTMLEKVSNKL